MKNQISLLVVFLMVIAVSCKDNEEPAPHIDAKLSCIRTETNVYLNGVPSGKTNYRHNDKSQTVVELSYNDKDELTDSEHHTYNANNLKTRSYYYSFPYKITQVQTWEYTAFGEIDYQEIAVNGKVTNSQQYFYSSGERLDSLHSLSSSNGMFRLLYTYENDKVKTITTFNPDSFIIEIEEYVYDGLKTTISSKDENGILAATIEITTNEDGLQTEWKQTDSFGNVEIHRVTAYDENNNIVSIIDDYGIHGIYEYRTDWKCP